MRYESYETTRRLGKILPGIIALGFALFLGGILLVTRHQMLAKSGSSVSAERLSYPESEESIRQRLRELAGDGRGTEDAVARFYRSRDYTPCWTTLTGLRPFGLELLRRFSTTGEAGPARLVEQARLAFSHTGSGRRLRLAELDWSLSEELRRVASHLVHGRLGPGSSVEQDWSLKDAPVDLAPVLQDAVRRGPDAVLEELARSHEERTGLVRALEIYRKIASAGGWRKIRDPKQVLALGTSSPVVRELRERLVATGDLEGDPALGPPEALDRFDGRVAAAVRRFQRRHGLAPDGRVGPETLAALNVPVETRLREIELNLERRRWLPGNLGREYVWINVPEYRLYAVRDGKTVLDMAVIVGKPKTPTPLFEDGLEYVVFNPYWNVPESIALDELLPKQRAEPGYLSRNRYQLLDQDSEPVPLARLSPEEIQSGQLRLRKLPGASNDLGRMKFMMPNRYSVYLHDTPSRYLFSRPKRAFSHGCIRLEQPEAFASFLLEGQMSAQEIEAALHSEPDAVRRLGRPIPVYIVYFTAFMKEGLVNFRDDLYHDDPAIGSALEASRRTGNRPT